MLQSVKDQSQTENDSTRIILRTRDYLNKKADATISAIVFCVIAIILSFATVVFAPMMAPAILTLMICLATATSLISIGCFIPHVKHICEMVPMTGRKPIEIYK